VAVSRRRLQSKSRCPLHLQRQCARRALRDACASGPSRARCCWGRCCPAGPLDHCLAQENRKRVPAGSAMVSAQNGTSCSSPLLTHVCRWTGSECSVSVPRAIRPQPRSNTSVTRTAVLVGRSRELRASAGPHHKSKWWGACARPSRSTCRYAKDALELEGVHRYVKEATTNCTTDQLSASHCPPLQPSRRAPWTAHPQLIRLSVQSA